MTTTTIASPDPNVVNVSLMDGMGQVTQSQLTSDPQGTDFVDTVYNGMGLVQSVSNPYRSASGKTGVVTSFQYDGLGRKIMQMQQDSSVLQWCYNGTPTPGKPSCPANASSALFASWTNTYDGLGNHRQQVSDGLGRLVAVLEPDASNTLAAETDYQYDAFNNLTSVKQVASKTGPQVVRTFFYDSLARLVRAYNPETGTICYGQWSSGSCINGYDANGNLVYKTDARGIVTNYTYDALNRLKQKVFSDGTRQQLFAYDGKDESGSPLPAPYNQNALGRLSHTSDSISVASHYGYDSMGRLTQKADCLPVRCDYSTVQTAGYDLAGNLTSFTYPDGRTMGQSFDSAGRVTNVNYSAWGGNNKNYSYLNIDSSAGYDPAGHVVAATMGNGTMMAAQYDNRQRTNWLAYGNPQQLLWGRQYAWTPNSNLQQMTDMLTGTQRQFGYDTLNRLTVAQDIVGSSSGADTSPYLQGNGGNTGGSAGGSTTPAASPQWTDPDESNILMSPDVISSVPGTNGWDFADITVAPGAVAPDGSSTAYGLTANQNATDGRLLATANNQYMYDNETMTASVWLRSPGGAKSIYLVLVESTGSAYDSPGGKLITVTPTWQQFSISGKYSSGRPIIQVEIGGGGTFTSGEIDVWGAKLEDTGQAGRTVTNFLPYSQRFTAGGWYTTQATVADNSAVAPDGTKTAATLTANSSADNGGGYLDMAVANPATFTSMKVTGSVWLRAPNGSQPVWLYLLNAGGDGFTAIASQQLTVGSQWTRVQVTGVNQTTLNTLWFQVAGSGSLLANQSIQVWGAQLELGSSAGPYVATGSSAASVGTGLTNLVTFSSQMTAPTWFGPKDANGAPLTKTNFNAVPAPDGTQTGLELTSNSSDGWIASWLNNPQMLEGATITGSVFLRVPSGSNRTLNLYVAFADAAGNRNYVVAQPVPLTTTWQRFSFSGTIPNALSAVLLQIGAGGSLTNGQSVDIWGPQIELSTSAGPYVPTSALPITSGQEPTNLFPASQQTNGPSWSSNPAGILVSNAATAPNNTQTAAVVNGASGVDTYLADDVPNPSLYDGETVTGSVYLRVPSGTLNLQIFLGSAESGGGFQAPSQQVTLTTSWQRFSITASLPNALTRLWLQIGGAQSYTGGQAIQVWGPQIVLGSSAGVYDATTTTTTSPVTGQPATLVANGLNDVYGYDSFGNMTRYNGWTPAYNANNQIAGWPYDAAGNLLTNGLAQMVWDAESRISAVTGASYLYDAQGNRVESSGSSVTDTVYFNGRPMARLVNGQWTDLIYGPTGLLAEVAGQENAEPQYRLLDHLGTQVGTTDSAQLLKNPLDYNPFGQIRSGSTADPYFFTGKERDTESGLDYFGARYYGSSMGRFMSPDWSEKQEPVPYSKLDDPQTLNLYTYGLNNPLSFVDDDGHFSRDTYVADYSGKHGGPHVDRYSGKQNVGRYRPDGTPIKHGGKTPDPVPNADRGKFDEAVKDLNKQVDANAQKMIDDQLKNHPLPGPPPLPDGLKPTPTPAPSPVPPVTPIPLPSPEPMPSPTPPLPIPEPMPMPMPMPMPEPILSLS